MAVFQAFNAAGAGFNMSGTSPSGWSFVSASPYIETVNTFDDGTVADFDVNGSSLIDAYSVWYRDYGSTIVIDHMLYENDGKAVLSIKNLTLETTIDDLYAYDWYVALNRGNDTFYGNDYADMIRAGNGNDAVYSYGGADIVFGDAGHDDLYGLNGDDDLYGGTGQDYLSGGAGSDYLSGGLDNDTLVGGTGRDYFVFDATPSRINVDTITDFRPLDDTIMLDNRIFTRLGPDGWLAGAAFWTGSRAHDWNDRIVYNKATGALLYDPDGIGAAAAVKFAQMKAGLALTAADFYVL